MVGAAAGRITWNARRRGFTSSVFARSASRCSTRGHAVGVLISIGQTEQMKITNTPEIESLDV